MLVACRLRGLSALEPYYAGVRALAQCEARRRQISTSRARKFSRLKQSLRNATINGANVMNGGSNGKVMVLNRQHGNLWNTSGTRRLFSTPLSMPAVPKTLKIRLLLSTLPRHCFYRLARLRLILIIALISFPTSFVRPHPLHRRRRTPLVVMFAPFARFAA